MKKRSDIYQIHLDRVSRSFAYCIRQLPDPQKQWVGLAYLLCRVADTLEDSQWGQWRDQEKAFKQFEYFITHQPTSLEIQEWLEKMPPSISKSEMSLLQASSMLVGDLHETPLKIRIPMQTAILNMCRGMRYFCENHAENGSVRLNSLLETNQYCFFVAGVVGELLTEIMLVEGEVFQNKINLWSNSYELGFFLQKINILKDQAEDQKAGRFFSPDIDDLFASLGGHARKGFEYILNIDKDNVAYRKFCAWSLYLGLASLPYIYANKSALAGKLPKLKALEVIAQVDAVILDDAGLKSLFSSFCSAAGLVLTPPKSGDALLKTTLSAVEAASDAELSQFWMLKIYDGRLGLPDFLNLNLVPNKIKFDLPAIVAHS